MHVRSIYSNQFIQAILFALLLFILYQVRVVVVVFILAFIIMSGLKPVTKFLQSNGFPRVIAILFPYAVLVIFVLVAGILILPGVLVEIGHFLASLPKYLEHLSSSFNIQLGTISESAISTIGGLVRSVATLPLSIMSIIISCFVVIVVSIYMQMYPTYLSSLSAFFEDKKRFEVVLDGVEIKMGAWIRSQLLLSLIVGIMVFIGMLILGVNYPFVLGLVAACFEVIPFFGSIISAIIAMLVASGTSLTAVGLVVLVFFLVNQIENNILVPQIMRRNVDVHPLTIILAIMTGNELFGVIGAILAVPVSVMLMILWRSRYSAGKADVRI